MIYLIPRHTKSHHNIGSCMGFRKHIFNLFTGPDIPVRNIMFPHNILFLALLTGFFIFISQKPSSLSHMFHNIKAHLRFNSFVHQINHDIITGTYSSRNGTCSFLNQRLGISKPYIRTMRQSRNTKQVSYLGRFCIHQHLNNKIRTKLRKT